MGDRVSREEFAKAAESSYQQTNSIMAIGSGQLLGKGLNTDALDSVKNGNYISEPQTDFIFAVAGEELGFIGSAIIVILLLAIVIECLRVAKKAKTKSIEFTNSINTFTSNFLYMFFYYM